jgi:hypothetical protein
MSDPYDSGGDHAITMRHALSIFILCISCASTHANAQEAPPQWLASLAKDPQSPEMREYARMRKERIGVERQMKRLRHLYFNSSKDTTRRQEGIAAILSFTDAAAFEPLIDIMGCEGTDVTQTLLKLFSDSDSRAGDTCIAWLSVHGCDDNVKAQARRQLRETFDESGEPPAGVNMVLYSGLRSPKESVRQAAAVTIRDLQIVSAIPWLIASQISGGANMGSVDRGDDGDLAWIAVGTQQAFVSDLTPVVGPNAVAFDPQLSVVTTGTLIRVQDAIVYEYHYEIHNPLVELTSSLTDTSTTRLGWDAAKWNEWFAEDFPALRAAKVAKDKAVKHHP